MEEQVEQNHTKLDDLLIGFQGKCDEDLGIYINTLRLYNTNPADFPKQMRDMLIEHIVVKLFSEWERFLENIFYQLYARRQEFKRSSAGEVCYAS